ncbi:CcdC protein domain-containing protein [Tuberibacillus calidus]|uniref:CcdC protein domain-containing protein n=1 Tax=Tuberibacillus calidus TaxID=340097 RepID=UPI00041DCF8C|nr:CcdC protein domain-containing protein [Tuberibacillus calidus]
MNQGFLPIALIVLIFLFGIYKRARRNIGLQRLSQGYLLFRIILFTVVGLIFFIEGAIHPISLVSNIVGIMIGAILAYYAVSSTTFEQREGKLYYRPNIWIGSLVTLLFLLRLIYRFYEVFENTSFKDLQKQTYGAGNPFSSLSHSWSSGLILIMFAYYIIYYAILLKRLKQLPEKLRN